MGNKACLCVGTFFSLIIEGMPNSGQKRKGKNANYAVMEKLLQVVSPEFKWTAESDKSTVTSKLKNCETYGNNLPLTDKICCDNFDAMVMENYLTALMRMADFAKTYVSNEKKDWLASALIELANMDDPTGKNLFFATENGKGVFARDFPLRVRYIEPLLLGIWHHIVMNCLDNTVGADVLNSWYSKKNVKHGTAKFIGDIGKNTKFKVRVEFMDEIPQNGETSNTQRKDENCADNATKENSAENGVTNNYFENPTLQFANVINNIEYLEHLD